MSRNQERPPLTQRLKDPKLREKIQSFAPPSIANQDVAQAALVYLYGMKPYLLDQIERVDTTEFMTVIFNILQAGIIPNEDHITISPYYSKKDQATHITWSITYQGKVDMVLGSGEIAAIYMDVHYEADEFAINLGTDAYVRHVPAFTDRGNPEDILGVYGILTHNNGIKQVAWMSKDEVDRCRAASKSGSDEAQEQYKRRNNTNEATGPWVTHYDQMAKKSLFHEMMKWCRLSPPLTKQLKADYSDYDFSLMRRPIAQVDKKTEEAAKAAAETPAASPEATQAEEEPKQVKLKRGDEAPKFEPKVVPKSDDDLSLPDDGSVEDMPPPPSNDSDDDLIEDDLDYGDSAPRPKADRIPDLPKNATPWIPGDDSIPSQEINEIRGKAEELYSEVSYQLCAYCLAKYGVPHWKMSPGETLARLANMGIKDKILATLRKFTDENVDKSEQKLRTLTNAEAGAAERAAEAMSKKHLNL